MKSTFKQTFKHLNILHSIYCSLFKTIGIMATAKAPQEQGSNDSVPREKRPLSDADDEQHIAKKARDHVDFNQLNWEISSKCFHLIKTSGRLDIGSYWFEGSSFLPAFLHDNLSAILFKKQQCVLQLMFRKEDELYFKNIFTNKLTCCPVDKLEDFYIRHIPFKYFRLMEIEAKNAEKEMTEFRAKATMEPVYLFSKQNVCLLEGDIIRVDGRLGWIDQAKVRLTFDDTYWHAELDILLLSNDGKERTKHVRVRTRAKVLSTKFVHVTAENCINVNNYSSITIEFVRRAGSVMRGADPYTHYFLPLWGLKHEHDILRKVSKGTIVLYKGLQMEVKEILFSDVKKDGIIVGGRNLGSYFTDVFELTAKFNQN